MWKNESGATLYIDAYLKRRGSVDKRVDHTTQYAKL